MTDLPSTLERLSDHEFDQVRTLMAWARSHQGEYTIHNVGDKRWQAYCTGEHVELYIVPFGTEMRIEMQMSVVEDALEAERRRRKVERVARRMLASIKEPLG